MPTLLQIVASSGQSIYAVIYNALGQVWNGSAFEAYNAANWSTYIVAAAEQASSGSYFATIPTGITTPGEYTWVAYAGAGAVGDTPVDNGDFIVPALPASFLASLTSSAPSLIQAVTSTGKTAYVFIWNAAGLIWNGTAFEVYNAARWAFYDISAPEQASSGNYFAPVPAGITIAGNYSWVSYIQLGGAPAAGDTPFDQGAFCVTQSASAYIASTGISGIILTLRSLAQDMPTSKKIFSEQLGGSSQPAFPVDGTNVTFRLQNWPLSDAAGAPRYAWVTIIGVGAVTRSQSLFTIVDPVNGIIQFAAAPAPGSTPQTAGVYVDYCYEWFTDDQYAQFLYQAAQSVIAGTTDPTTIENGLVPAMIQYALAQFWYSRASQYAERYAATAGDSSEQAEAIAKSFISLGNAANKRGDFLKTDFYERQGQRNAPYSVSQRFPNIGPITPRK